MPFCKRGWLTEYTSELMLFGQLLNIVVVSLTKFFLAIVPTREQSLHVHVQIQF